MNYQITEKDLTGEIEGFPIEVVNKMIEEQVKQGNEADVTVFQEQAKSSLSQGGFVWSGTTEGNSFWHNIIVDNQFDVFFEKYSKESNIPQTFKIVVKNKKLLEAMWEDLIQLGYGVAARRMTPYDSNTKEQDYYISCNAIVETSKTEHTDDYRKCFTNLFAGAINCNFHKEFTLPDQYQEALEFTEEQLKHPHWETLVKKILKFGDVEFMIDKESHCCDTKYGKVTLNEIKIAIDYIENPPSLFSYELCVNIAENSYYTLAELNEYSNGTVKIGFGCKTGVLEELKAIYKALID